MLKGLGHEHLFDVNVPHDFSKMTEEEIFISDASHAVQIRVDQEGTVAAAATMYRIAGCSPNYLRICVDKPFLFFIRSGEHVVFAGRMVDPTKASNGIEAADYTWY